MPLQNLYLDADSLRIGANQFLTQANAVYIGNNLHVGNTLIMGVAAGNNQWPIPTLYPNSTKIVIAANNPLWSGFGGGAIDLRVGTAGGRVGITFSSNTNYGSDGAYLYYNDTLTGYTSAPGGETSVFLLGTWNDSSATPSNEDVVAIEGPGNIFLNPGMGTSITPGGATSWSNTQGNLWVGNNSVKYLAIHEGLQANVTLRAPITFANSANALVFSGASNTNITLRTSPNGILSFDGGAGSLLSISNNILGQIFSVNDISGFPVLEVTANTVPSNTFIQMGQFGSKVSIGTNTTSTSRLTISSNSTVNALEIQGTVGSNTGYFKTPSGTFFSQNGANELVILALGQLRFSDSSLWSYDAWGGLRWVSANNTMIIGGPGAPGITNNAVVSSNVVIHNGTTGNFMVANTAATNLFVGANGNVGIGNSTPTNKLRVEGTASISSDLTVAGNLTVSGTTTYINTTNLTIGDNIIALNADLGAVAPSENAGIEVNRGSSANVQFIWDETNDYWALGNTSVTGFVNATASVNSAVLSVGTAVIANSIGVTTTGFVNAASHIVGGSFTANSIGVTTTGFVNANSLRVATTITANGATGTTGQVLQSNSTGGAYWATLVSGATLVANTTDTQTFYFPMSNATSGSWTNAVVDTVITFVPSTNLLTVGGDLTVSGNISGAAANVQIVAGAFTTTFANNGVITLASSISSTNTIAAGNTTITGFANVTTSVNSALLTVGTSFIANTTGAYHTGTVNAASVTVGTAVIANSTGVTTTGFVNSTSSVNAASHTVGTSFIANSTGTYHTGTINAASHTVSTSFIANSTGVTTTGFVNANSLRVATTFTANGALGTTGQVLQSNSTGGAYWAAISAGATLVANTTDTQTFYFPMSNSQTGSWTNAVVDNILTFVPSTNTLKLDTGGVISVGNSTVNTYINSEQISTTTAFANTVSTDKVILFGALQLGEDTGTAGQALTSTGTGTAWSTISAGATLVANTTDTQTFYFPLSNATSGSWTNAVVDSALTFVPSTNVLSLAGTVNATSSVNSAVISVGTSFIANSTGAYHTGRIKSESELSVGIDGFFISFFANSTGTTINGFANVTTSVNSALLTVGTNFIANSTGITTTGFANVSTLRIGSTLTANGATGTTGQILQANSTGGVYWATVSGGATLTANNTDSQTFYIPMANATSGSWSNAVISTTKMYFYPSSGTLNATVFNSLSDENKKTNIQIIPNALDIVNGIDGVTFDFTDSGMSSAGLLAGQIEQFLPQLVSTNHNGEKSLNYNGVIGVLVEAVKTLSKEVEELKKLKV